MKENLNIEDEDILWKKKEEKKETLLENSREVSSCPRITGDGDGPEWVLGAKYGGS
jgi:hypothetical protein